MPELTEIPDEARRELASHLAGVRKTFLTVVHTLEDRPVLEGPAATVQHQLKWAAAHVQAAVLALKSRDGEPEVETPPALPPTRTVRPRLAGEEEPPGEVRHDDGLDFSEGLRGHTQAISIAEILGFIASIRKSGTLVVHGESEGFLIELHNGAVVYAEGDNPPAGLLLGEILAAQGSLAQEDLEEFLREHPTEEEVLGTALLQEGLISREALRIALSYQIQHLFYRVTTERDAYFQFEENVNRIHSDDIRLNVQMLLLESARTLDERDAGLG